jgi:hypothetical protein
VNFLDVIDRKDLQLIDFSYKIRFADQYPAQDDLRPSAADNSTVKSWLMT